MDTQTTTALDVSIGFQLKQTKGAKQAIAVSGCTLKGMVQHMRDHARGYAAVVKYDRDPEKNTAVERTVKVSLPAYCSAECLARTFYHSAHPRDVRKIRQAGKIGQLFKVLLHDHDEWLLMKRDAGGYRTIREFKLLKNPTENELALATAQYESMAKRAENAATFFARASGAFQKRAGYQLPMGEPQGGVS